jgi:hypothetical protein
MVKKWLGLGYFLVSDGEKQVVWLGIMKFSLGRFG